MERDLTYPSLGNWSCIKTLGYGQHSKVKLAKNISTGEEVAIKIIKLDDTSINFKQLSNEIDMMRKLEHPNVIKLKEFYDKLDYKKRNGKTIPVAAIVMEVAKGGELFEYINKTGRLLEEEARTIFHVLIETIEFFHLQGIAHRNLKLENLLFDADFNLKVTDFGYATCCFTSLGIRKLTTIPNAENYLAPEVFSSPSYDGMVLDLYSASIILFLMVSGIPPFMRAEVRDPFYKLISMNRYDNFWLAHEKDKKKKDQKAFFSEEFKRFINSTLASDPAQRLTLSEIKSHPWYLGKCADIREFKEKFDVRRRKVEEELKKQHENKLKEKEKIKEQVSNQGELRAFSGIRPIFRGEEDEDLETKLSELKLKVPDLDKDRETLPTEKLISRPQTSVFSVLDTKSLFQLLVLHAKGAFVKFKVSPNLYQIKGRINSDDGACSMKITISEIDENTNCIEFQRREGSNFIFYQALEDKFLTPMSKYIIC